MATTDAETLELYRVSLHNARSQPAILEILDQFGYGLAKLDEGQAKLDAARAAYEGKNIEKSETFAARIAFEAKWDELFSIYALDRRKAKAVFNKDPAVLQRLALIGNLSRSYIRWIETARTFYTVCLAAPEIQTRLLRTKITPEHLDTAYAMLADLEGARALYIRERGESQNATKLKDEAFARIEEWMREFYTFAKIALEESPQLAESLGKLVRS